MPSVDIYMRLNVQMRFWIKRQHQRDLPVLPRRMCIGPQDTGLITSPLHLACYSLRPWLTVVCSQRHHNHSFCHHALFNSWQQIQRVSRNFNSLLVLYLSPLQQCAGWISLLFARLLVHGLCYSLRRVLALDCAEMGAQPSIRPQCTIILLKCWCASWSLELACTGRGVNMHHRHLPVLSVWRMLDFLVPAQCSWVTIISTSLCWEITSSQHTCNIQRERNR